MSGPTVAQNEHRNEVHIAGTLVNEPAVRFTSTGKKVATIRVATTNKEHTEYHRCVLWEKFADRVEGLSKGDFIKLIGRLQTRSWEDSSKTKRYTTEVVAWNIGIPGKDAVTVSTTGAEVSDGDLPF